MFADDIQRAPKFSLRPQHIWDHYTRSIIGIPALMIINLIGIRISGVTRTIHIIKDTIPPVMVLQTGLHLGNMQRAIPLRGTYITTNTNRDGAMLLHTPERRAPYLIPTQGAEINGRNATPEEVTSSLLELWRGRVSSAPDRVTTSSAIRKSYPTSRPLPTSPTGRKFSFSDNQK